MNGTDLKLLHYNAHKAGIKVSTIANKPCSFTKGSKNRMKYGGKQVAVRSSHPLGEIGSVIMIPKSIIRMVLP